MAATPALPQRLPDGTRLLHVGPHKTGTATLQGAFHAARDAVLDQDVRYAGRTRQAIEAANAITQSAWQQASGSVPDLCAWHRLVREARAARERYVVISAESFSHATVSQARRIADELDSERLHVVVTLRPIERILPSRWQQAVQDDRDRLRGLPARGSRGAAG